MGIEALLAASYELRAVVFDPEARRFWQQLAQRVKGDGRLAAGLAGGFDVDGKAGVGVDEGEQAAAQAIAQSIAQAHHGIAGDHFQRWMFAAFGLAGDEFVAADGGDTG
ncbi:hypothetical protein [Candidatus Spongiihabitans sp.]|uniref:hypothetical protein n=1 Tax=Candidatus Spongiihabitans sp. TaxID=3101308 RepID=UPI003C6FBAA8